MAEVAFSMVASAAIIWVVGIGVPLMMWNRRLVKRDVHRWLARRGVSCPTEVTPQILWLRGGVGIGGEPGRFQFQGQRLTIGVVLPSAFVIESQWPLLPWRRRLIVSRGTVLRRLGERVADPKRRCLVASSPPEHLISLLHAAGWDLKEVPF